MKICTKTFLMGINEAIQNRNSQKTDIKNINQARDPGLEYFFKKTKADKKPVNARQFAKVQDALDAKMKIITVSLEKVGMSSESAQITKLSKGMDAYLKAKEEFENKKSKLKEIIPALFDTADAACTRVVETAGVICTYSKETTRSNFDKNVFIEKMKEVLSLYVKEAEEVNKIIEASIEQSTKISNVASSVSVDLKEAQEQDGFFTKLWKKVSSAWKRFTSFITRKYEKVVELDKEIRNIINK